MKKNDKPFASDTISAISTPAGMGGIAVVRISGSQALAFAAPILSYRGILKDRTAKIAALDTGVVQDQVILLYFKAPRSFTGEDVLEIHCHGSYFLACCIVEALIANGCRAAEPGEFTRRAFLNGRVDLTAAEGIIDLIQASSVSAVTAAYAQVKGETYQTFEAIQKRLTGLIAAASAAVDYPEEDLATPARQEILSGAAEVVSALLELRDSYKSGRLLREGVRVAIVGAPNVGKSALLNRLLGASRSIVTPEPGTTRDTVEESFSYKGVQFVLTDTAGMREADSEAERQGIERSIQAAKSA
ncbi:MAG: tRNA uridine-5-carboxymethylaminomethyl(34) synthesis GTPase MnmE, partial [Firmicutes bacterium]|nr:tRNA uridine-5-carboxymethylaminomethyl(34) synthesis GTPase MnmE [Bacillota bacterium]